MHDPISLDHFNAIAAGYAGRTGALDPLFDAIRGELEAAVAGKDVLDVGSGGSFPFDRRLAASLTSLDLSPAMLARVPAGVSTVVADARDRMPFPDAAFDAVLFSLSLHHLVGRSLAETEDGQAAAVAEAFRVLRPGGRLIVYEPILPPALFALERALYRPISALFALVGVPPVYFRSRASLQRLADFEVVAPRVTGWVDPLSGTFPSFLRLPIAVFPTRYELFLARKPVG
jgi:SAM-dependent methyltransferase